MVLLLVMDNVSTVILSHLSLCQSQLNCRDLRVLPNFHGIVEDG
jgi:hypothetical protein